MKDKLGIKRAQQSDRVTGGKRILGSKEHKDEKRSMAKQEITGGW